MKTLLIALVVALGSFSTLCADVVVAGKIATFTKDTGTLTLVPESRTVTPMTFVNMDKAIVLLPTGERGTMADLQPGRGATIHHAVVGNRLIVSKVVLAEPPPPAVVPVVPTIPGAELTTAEKRALETPAANDGDRTTNPGAKARIDKDITTKPGQKDVLDRDITKKPADSANKDGDRTTNK